MMMTCSQTPLLVHVIFVLNDFMKKQKTVVLIPVDLYDSVYSPL